MNHEEMQFFLSAFIDDELTSDDRSVVDNHLRDCDDCRRRVDQLITMKNIVRLTGNFELPYAFASTLARSIYRDEEVAVSWLGIEHYAMKYVFGLAMLVLLLLGITSYRQTEDPLPVERYVSGISTDSAVSQLLTKPGTITRDDVMLAALTK
jgi:anti-sigma factor RsiW